MRGRSAGAETTVRAVVASTSPQSATSNLVPLFSPVERRIQEQATLRSAIAKRNFGQIYICGRGYYAQCYLFAETDVEIS
jgi:hypothetical protein